MADENSIELNPDILSLWVINPDKIVYEAKVKKIFLPTKLGEIAILPQHTPLYTELVEGTIKIEEDNGSIHEESVDGGVVKVKENIVKILIGF